MNITTESSSNYDDLEQMSIQELLININNEDSKITGVIQTLIPKIQILVECIVDRMLTGGRIFYIGAGTSGRLGILDASEIPPTFGTDDGVVVGLIAGGDKAIRKAVESAEDNKTQGWKDLQNFDINKNDTLIGIAASGTTPYVIEAIKTANENGLLTGCITCNSDSPLSKVSQYPLEAIVGPEFVTGSTRMKAGTAQKLILNMISTTCMIKLGKVKGNKMVNMQLTNAKLVDRGTKMIIEELKIDYDKAKSLLLKYGSVKNVIDNYRE